MSDPFTDELRRFLEARCTPAHVRAFEAGTPTTQLWNALEELGYPDALEAGLGLSDLAAMARLAGRYLLPVPLLETMFERALGAPPGREVLALVTAGKMAGAMDRVLELTLEYANVRQQFGKPLGKFQAIQQQLAVMAEHVIGANMAVELGFAGEGTVPDPLRAALAKEYSSRVSGPVVAIAHAVHGAIGLSAEYDLSLFARRLHAWRIEHGSESYWAERIGRARLGAGTDTLDFVRASLGS